MCKYFFEKYAFFRKKRARTCTYQKKVLPLHGILKSMA